MSKPTDPTQPHARKPKSDKLHGELNPALRRAWERAKRHMTAQAVGTALMALTDTLGVGEVRIAIEPCDHAEATCRLRPPGAIHPKGKAMVRWCIACGALSLDAGETWRLPEGSR